MKFTADEYKLAALERADAARILFAQAHYAASIYFVGVAVECILRAYRVRINPEFDERHDLSALLQASALEQFLPAKQRQRIGASLGEVWARWKNDVRYASDDRLARRLRKLGLFFGVRGDPLKANARVALDAGLEIVNIGVAKWNSSSSSTP